MIKGFFKVLLSTILIALLAISIVGCDDVTEDEARAMVEDFLTNAYELNEIYFGSGLKYRDSGKAKITLTPDTLSLRGIINGEEIDLSMPTASFPSLPFKPGRNFEIQHGDISYRCFPQKPLVVMKWVNLVKIFYEIKTREKEAEKKV